MDIIVVISIFTGFLFFQVFSTIMGKPNKKVAADAHRYKRERELANARNRKYKANMSADKLEKNTNEIGRDIIV